MLYSSLFVTMKKTEQLKHVNMESDGVNQRNVILLPSRVASHQKHVKKLQFLKMFDGSWVTRAHQM